MLEPGRRVSGSHVETQRHFALRPTYWVHISFLFVPDGQCMSGPGGPGSREPEEWGKGWDVPGDPSSQGMAVGFCQVANIDELITNIERFGWGLSNGWRFLKPSSGGIKQCPRSDVLGKHEKTHDQPGSVQQTPNLSLPFQ